jgi:8-hydroxy-5-deazaflavin:NADPH oxidoreductase
MAEIAIIGSGNVGTALHRGLTRARYEARTSTKADARPTATWGEIVILAVPFGAIEEVVRETAGALDRKTIVDVTNALTPDMEFAHGDSTSGAEEQYGPGLANDIGFDAVNAGPLKNARWLEAVGFFNIQLGHVLGLGTQIGLHLIRREES